MPDSQETDIEIYLIVKKADFSTSASLFYHDSVFVNRATYLKKLLILSKYTCF